MKQVQILGTRGIPGGHGGFESFVERLAPYLARNGWHVTVYCQVCDPTMKSAEDDVWQGVNRVLVPVSADTTFNSFLYDCRSIKLAMKRPGLCLVLGYNTAVLTLLLAAQRKKVVMNMDGIEWRRGKWSPPYKAWFYVNDWVGSLASNHLIADHPRIADHLASRTSRWRITTIVYGADAIEGAEAAPLDRLGLRPGEYLLSICRPEPENSVLELVRAFSQTRRGRKLVVLGRFGTSAYHRAVKAAASDEVVFPGAIYDPEVIRPLRFHCLAYCHGHTVGGTNPSLVEALGAGNAVIARDNLYNRWVAGDEQLYFDDEASCAARIAEAVTRPERLAVARAAARARHRARFTWGEVLSQYDELLGRIEADLVPESEVPVEAGALRLFGGR
jgi:glycosyltransferase involved in cell wall biosynthesis